MGVKEEQTFIGRFLKNLAGQLGDRGAMADLRHGFSETTEYRAWPYLANWCDLRKERERAIWLTVAAGFATHGGTAQCGNLGWTLRHIARGDGKGEEGLKSFEGRFRRLLTSAHAEELCRLLPGILRAAERKGVPVNYECLFWDLQTWHKPEKNVKVHWAQAYWATEQQEAS